MESSGGTASKLTPSSALSNCDTHIFTKGLYGVRNNSVRASYD